MAADLGRFAESYDPAAPMTHDEKSATWAKLAHDPPTYTTSINHMVVGAKPGAPTLFVGRHADVQTVLKAPKIFTAPKALVPSLPQPSPSVRDRLPTWPGDAPTLFGTEPWTAAPVRRIVATAWTRARLASQKPAFTASAEKILAPYLSTGEIEMTGQFGRPFVFRLLLVDVLGLPDDICDMAIPVTLDGTVIFLMALGMEPKDDAKLEPISLRHLALRDRLAEEISKQAQTPAPGLISDLLHARLEEDTPISEDVVMDVVYHILAAVDNPVLFFGTALDFFLDRPALWADMVADPEVIPAYVEEALRLRPPLPFLQTRLTLADTEIGGVAVPRGTLVAIHAGAANLDPTIFPDPEAFRPNRPEIAETLTFSDGAHRCLAPWLARMMVNVGIEVLARELPNIRRSAKPRRPFFGLQEGYEDISFEWDVSQAPAERAKALT